MDAEKLSKIKETLANFENIDLCGYDSIEEMENALNESARLSQFVQKYFHRLLYLKECKDDIKVTIKDIEFLISEEAMVKILPILIADTEAKYNDYAEQYKKL